MKKALAIAALLATMTLAAGMAMSGERRTSGTKCCPLSACPRTAVEKAGCSTCTLPCKPCPDCTLCTPGISRAL